jgi:hypothetical protein
LRTAPPTRILADDHPPRSDVRHHVDGRGQHLGSLISLRKAADSLDVSVRTGCRRVASGELPAFRSGRRIIQIRIDDVETMLRRVPAAMGFQDR